MTLRIYNTLTREKEDFVPVNPGKVGMYLCGPTVYKPAHIGHMVGPVIFDTIKKYLAYLSYDVTWIVNITDVDDDIHDFDRIRRLRMYDDDLQRFIADWDGLLLASRKIPDTTILSTGPGGRVSIKLRLLAKESGDI